MDLRYYLLRCPYCMKVWGRTESYSDENYEESEELIESAPCPACKKQQQAAAVSAKNNGH